MKTSIVQILKVVEDFYSDNESGKSNDSYEVFFIKNKKNFHLWRNLFKSLDKNIHSFILSSAHYEMIDPSFTQKILVKKTNIENFTYYQYMMVHLSVVGNYFTLYGIEFISVNTDYENCLKIEFEPVVFISPQGVYKKWFNILSSIININYPEYVFLPYYILEHRVKNINTSVYNKTEYGHSLYELLFNLNDITNFKKYGDIMYDGN